MVNIWELLVFRTGGEQLVRKMEISHGSTLHNHKLFKEIGGFNLKFKICADYDFYFAKKMNSLLLIEKFFLMQIGGMSNSVKGLFDAYR